ncbi:MAG: MarR family transcriptional regulator [Sinobacteraceae bacterium]|nr:MarR family transcriptional regulator [Burkholderiaceae bacterium]MCP5340067.1 MarR family transcriptional regulator [Nevskiaceae bacterium]
MNVERELLHSPKKARDRRSDVQAGQRADAYELWESVQVCTQQIADEIQRRLRDRFGISLARFELMAELREQRRGLPMRSLARRLMVTSANVTGLTDELEREGLVVREIGSDDRRVRLVRLTAQGRRALDHMAREHRRWVLELFSVLDADVIDQIHDQLRVLRDRGRQQSRGIDADERRTKPAILSSSH